MFEDLTPEIAITLAMVNDRPERIGVVWTYEQAETIFKMYQQDVLVLCVKVPMCKFCISCSEASAFFEDRCWR